MESHFEIAIEAFRRDDMDATFEAINKAMTSEESNNPAVFSLLGEALLKLGYKSEAAEAFEEAGKRDGPDALDFQKYAILLHEAAGNRERAFLLCLQYQKLRPDDTDIVYIIVQELMARGETDLLVLFQNRLVASDNADHLTLARDLIGDDGKNPHTLALFKKLSDLAPEDPYVRFKYYSVAREFCDYPVLDEANRFIRRELSRGNVNLFEAETPYSNLLHCSDENLNRSATNNRDIAGPPPADQPAKRHALPHQWAEKIRIGYLSSDFWDDHATMRLMQSVIETHDHSRFDVTLYCYTPERYIAMDGGGRERWQPIISVLDMSDEMAAHTIRGRGCDILVDLKGHTGNSRSKILNRMVAPIQVGWLGFPGSTVNVDLDYVIGDAIVLPDSAKPFYHEKFCRLPNSYQPNDPVHRPIPPALSRSELGLPDDKFIFASFNSCRKITLETFDLWAEILRQSEDSVLWVMIDSELARANFLARMRRHGIFEDRIIFAAKTDYANHLARIQAADLGLDTFPYNGHTTTSDCLWAGLPVLTCKGTNFASRVSESLLRATGMDELVAETKEGYFAQAVDLAGRREAVADLKQRLTANRPVAQLFDVGKFTANLETAYEIMVKAEQSGLAPQHIDV